MPRIRAGCTVPGRSIRITWTIGSTTPSNGPSSFDDPARDAWQLPDRVIETLAIKPGQIVADIGAGTGYFTVRLAKSAPAARVYGVDIEQSMVDYLSHRAMREGLKNVTAVQGGSDRTNLPEPVDVVLIVDTFHHIPQRVAYFTALKKLMKPGARLAIVDFKKDSPEGPPKEFRFTPDEISAELGKAGFSLQRQARLPAAPDVAHLRGELIGVDLVDRTRSRAQGAGLCVGHAVRRCGDRSRPASFPVSLHG